MSKVSRVITCSEWERVYNQMIRYRRKSGFVDLVDDKLTFFDSDPKINGVSACFVTIEDVREWKSEEPH